MAKKPPVPQKASVPPGQARAQYWLKQLRASSKVEADWREQTRKIGSLYRNAKRSKSQLDSSYNILYANVEVLKGTLYQKPPVPEVRRRFRDKDPTGKQAAEVLDRALTYTIDSYDFDHVIREVLQDRLLGGRGVAYVKYVPTFVPEEPANAGATQATGEGADKEPELPIAKVVAYEEVVCEYVDWSLFRYSKGAKRWEDVKWVAFGEVLDKNELKKRFPKTWSEVSLSYKAEQDTTGTEPGPFPEDSGDVTNQALVWMIWSKVDRKVYWVTEGWQDGLLGEKDDPLGLEGFFPCARPLYGQFDTDSLIPVPDYVQYQDQAEELNVISKRIIVLVDQLRRNGVYDSTFNELARVLKAPDGTFVAVENYAALADKGGVQNTLYEMPIEGVSKVVQNLYAERQQIIQVIYDITGIGDIVRGQTNPNETASAQELKANFANSRIGPAQREVQRWLRDTLRIMAEVIAEHFSAKTLQMITGIQLPTAQQKLASQQQAAMAQQQGQPPPPPITEPTWDEVMALLKNERLRGTRIDVETDSTLVLNDADDKQAISELINGIGLTIQSLTPAVQSGLMSKEAAGELLLSMIRYGGFSYRVEEAIEANPPQPPPDPTAADKEKMQTELQADAQMEQFKAQAQLQVEQLKAQTQLQMKQMELEHTAQMQQVKSQGDMQMEQVRHANKQDLEFMKGGTAGGSMADTFNALVQGIQQLGAAVGQLGQQQQAEAQQIGLLQEAVTAMIGRLSAPKRVLYGPDGSPMGIEVAGYGTQPVQKDASGRIVGTGTVQ